MKSKPFPSRGPAEMALGNVFFGLLPILVKACQAWGFGGPQLSLYRFGFACLALAILALAGKARFTFTNRKAVVWRGIFGGLAVLFYFMALDSVSAAQGTLLNYTFPLWTPPLGALLYGEGVRPAFWAWMPLACIGLYLVLDPRFQTLGLGSLYGLLSGLFAGASVSSLKEARKTDSTFTVFGSFSVFGVLVSLLGLAFFHEKAAHASLAVPAFAGWGLVALMAACAMFSQVMFTKGYGHTSLALGSALSMSVPVLTALFGWLILGERLTWHFAIGAGLILTACVGVGQAEIAE